MSTENSKPAARMKKAERRWWGSRLRQLYDSAKRSQGQSLSIYSEVSTLLDYLEEIEPEPEGLRLNQECDRIASKLRELGGYSRGEKGHES